MRRSARTSEYGLRLKSCAISVPVRKRQWVDIPGGNGQIDLMEGFCPARYEQRTVRAVFEPITDALGTALDAIQSMEGEAVKICLPNDSVHYMNGVAHVEGGGERPGSPVSISFLCIPWRESVNERVIQVPANSEGRDALLHNGGKREIIPTVVAGGDAGISYGDQSISLSAGTYELPALTVLGGEELTITVTGGPVTVKYREAVL